MKNETSDNDIQIAKKANCANMNTLIVSSSSPWFMSHNKCWKRPDAEYKQRIGIYLTAAVPIENEMQVKPDFARTKINPYQPSPEHLRVSMQWLELQEGQRQ